MTQPIIDTDVIIRFLTGDDQEKRAAAATLFEQVEQGLLTIAAPDTVSAETVYVLSSQRLYHLARNKVQELLTALAHLPHFQIQNRSAVLRALEWSGSTKLDFGDILILAPMEQQHSHIQYSYDADFDRFDDITRQEP